MSVGRRRGHRGPPLCLLLLLLTARSRPQIISPGGRPVLTGVQPVAAATSELTAPSLLSCLHACIALAAAGVGCGAVHHHGTRCRLYQHAACQHGGQGLQQSSSAAGRYVEPAPSSQLCPTDDPCSLLCPRTGRVLFGHTVPETTDVWTGGDRWTDVWKRLADGQCRVSLAAAAAPSTGKLTVAVAAAADRANSTLHFIATHSYSLILPLDAPQDAVGSPSALQAGRPLTHLELSWCAGHLMLYLAGELVLSVAQPVLEAAHFVHLSSEGVARWRLGADFADPWMMQPEGWSDQRSYAPPPRTAVWRRVPESATASVQFRCSSQQQCRVFFRQSFGESLQAIVSLAHGGSSMVGVGNDTHSAWQHAWWIDWTDGSQPHWFRVEISSGTVSVYTEDPDDATVVLGTRWALATGEWFSRVPTTVQYVGLGSDDAPANFWVCEYNPDWGFEQGFMAGAGLFTAEEAESLWEGA